VGKRQAAEDINSLKQVEPLAAALQTHFQLLRLPEAVRSATFDFQLGRELRTWLFLGRITRVNPSHAA
jgi:hypothetical protein